MLTLLLLPLAWAGPGPTPGPPPPAAGYSLIAEASGVQVYEQPWTDGAPDYLLVVDLLQATVTSLLDPVGTELNRHTAPGFWERAAGAEGRFAVLNGAFFSTASDPTSPAFGLRADPYGYVHGGYGTHSEYVGQQRSLHIRNSHERAAIVTADPSTLGDAAAAPEQVVALDPDADKSATSWVQRTFAGVRDPHDGGYRTLLFFVSEVATQEYAHDELLAWGAVHTMMLDGGGSTQLRVDGVDLVASTREVPHVLLVQAWHAEDGDSGSSDGGSSDGGTTDGGGGDTDAGGGGAPDGGSPEEATGTRQGPADPGCGCAEGGGRGAGWLGCLSLLALLAARRPTDRAPAPGS